MYYVKLMEQKIIEAENKKAIIEYFETKLKNLFQEEYSALKEKSSSLKKTYEASIQQLKLEKNSKIIIIT
jgi:hypothetical protein